jgi:demethylmenaquinone methyltransferase/2-methoxy-6-polyprenyl-1,4-benzoquinol methylase
MDKQEVQRFFDRLAPDWDDFKEAESAVIQDILKNAGIQKGQRVLDVACGTGVLFPYYEALGVQEIVGIDLSPEMTRIARQKAAEHERITVLTGDVEEARFDAPFDAVVVYNAFPHFPDGARLIARLAGLLKPGGRFTIAHGSGRDEINSHHQAHAAGVSVGLPDAETLKTLMLPYFEVDSVVDDDRMYQLAGTKRG